MKLLRVFLRFTFIGGVAVSSIGCASFKAGQPPEIGVFPSLPLGVNKPKTTYELTFKGGHAQSYDKTLEDEFVQVLKGSGYFDTLEKSKAQGDLNIQVDVVRSWNPFALLPAAITGASFWIIPSWHTDKIVITSYIQAAGGKQREYKMEGAVTAIQWLPMIFTCCMSHHPARVQGEIRENIYKNLVLQMQKDGFLPKAEGP